MQNVIMNYALCTMNYFLPLQFNAIIQADNALVKFSFRLTLPPQFRAGGFHAGLAADVRKESA